MKLIEFTDRGLYVAAADTYIDPWKKVNRAIITHGHSDHSRSGHQQYICTENSLPVIKHRLGSSIKITGVPYGKSFRINNVKFTFYPAGHIIGSAQIRVEFRGEVWVVSGDYKLQDDGLCQAFEPVKCHTFITESTFGLPIFDWQDQQYVIDDINRWWKDNKNSGKVSIISAYALGKAQRIIHSVDHSIGNIFVHGAVENTNEVLRKQGIELPDTKRISSEYKPEDYSGALVIAPPSSTGASWAEGFKSYSRASVSGWMALRKRRLFGGNDKCFVLSDHADWKELNTAVKETGAENVYVTHGYSRVYSRWLKSQGLNAQEVKTEYQDDDELEEKLTEE